MAQSIAPKPELVKLRSVLSRFYLFIKLYLFDFEPFSYMTAIFFSKRWGLVHFLKKKIEGNINSLK